MIINLPYKVRAALYIAIGIVSPLVAYFSATGAIDENIVTTYAAIVTFISGLAAINVSEE